jgi:hypothetical protein
LGNKLLLRNKLLLLRGKLLLLLRYKLLLLRDKLLLLRDKLLLRNKPLLLRNKLLLSEGGLYLLDWGRRLHKTPLLVRKVMGVDERIHSGTVGAGWNTSPCLALLRGELQGLLRGELQGLLGGELGGISIVLEVAVSGVVGIDERVEVGVHRSVIVLGVIKRLGNGCRGKGGLAERSLSRGRSCGVVRVKCGRVEAGGARGDVISLQDPESIFSRGVLDHNILAIIVYVTVLANPLSISSGLLPEDDPILLGIGRSKPSVSRVESLLL